ncbi:MAG TPA: TylF/MycF/NovP-related O-methyltransferase [Segetibacter sp.]|jgi:O-methyltransferase
MRKSLSKSISSKIEGVLIGKGWVLIKTMRLLHRKRNIDLSYKGWDFFRYSSLELCAHEINRNNISGSVAEVGVFQGEFAQKINEAFPKRKLYLFDTFEGFHKDDVSVENEKGYSTADDDFSNTSEKMVLDRMQSPENCIIKKGYFPETAKDVTDTFVFVSLDADLYKPIYDGLKFFYPKLARGGYIFVHDFNNDLYKGAREAVEKFCGEEGVGYFPLSDIAGSVILCK